MFSQLHRLPGRLYLHVWDPKTKQLELPGLSDQVKAVYLLADKAKNPLVQRRNGQTLTIDLPETLPDPNVSVVVVEIEGEVAVEK